MLQGDECADTEIDCSEDVISGVPISRISGIDLLADDPVRIVVGLRGSATESTLIIESCPI